MAQTKWEIGRLHLRLELVWSMATSSLRIRIHRSLLTGMTITTATSFMMYLLTMPRADAADAAEMQGWYLMLVLALVVSTAGVLNAMLTSVAQRYREIGTIKCLGALDSLVLYSVLMEAALLGLVGAVAGVVVGTVISTLLALADFGLGAFARMGLHKLPLHVLAVFAVGMMLTTFGAAVPAYIASKMPPVEAMRGEK